MEIVRAATQERVQETTDHRIQLTALTRWMAHNTTTKQKFGHKTCVWERPIKCKFRYLSNDETTSITCDCMTIKHKTDSDEENETKRKNQNKQIIRRISKQIGFSSHLLRCLCVCVCLALRAWPWPSHLNIPGKERFIYARDIHNAVCTTRRPYSLSWTMLNRPRNLRLNFIEKNLVSISFFK